MFQCRLGRGVTQVRLYVLNGSKLRHVGRAGAPKHLVGDLLNTRFLARFPQYTEQKVIGIGGRAEAVTARPQT